MSSTSRAAIEMRPLSGVKVVEASSYITGPFAALTLADLGAEVTKVEPPNGDPMRRFGMRHGGDGVGYSFVSINRNKRGASIDLKDPEGQRQLHDLLEDADVFVTNWRPGVAERLGLADVQEKHPSLVWVRVSGYGQDGPQADLPAFDSILQARSGVVACNGDPPSLVPGYMADKVTGILAAQAVLAGLLDRGRTGNGSVIDVSMIDAMTYFAAPDLLSGLLPIDAPEPSVIRYLAGVRPLRTSDGWIVISPVSGRQLKSALSAMDHAEWTQQLLAATDPIEMITLLYSLAETVLSGRSSSEWEEVFKAADVSTDDLPTPSVSSLTTPS